MIIAVVEIVVIITIISPTTIIIISTTSTTTTPTTRVVVVIISTTTSSSRGKTIREILVAELERHLVDVVVGVLRERLELRQAAELDERNAVDVARRAGRLAQLIAALEERVERLERAADDLRRRVREQQHQVLEQPVGDEEVDLLRGAAVERVLQGVDALEAQHDVVVAQHLDAVGHDLGLEDLLYLVVLADEQVADAPDDLLADRAARVADEEVEDGRRAGGEHDLVLLLGAAGEVADDADRGQLEEPVGVRQEADDLGDHARKNDLLHAVGVALADVADRPQRVADDVVVVVVQQRAQHGQRPRHRVEVRRGAVAAQVRHGPHGVARHGNLLGLHVDAVEQRLHRAVVVQEHVAHGNGLAREVADRPRGLLADGVARARELDDDGRHGVELDDVARVGLGAGDDVGDGPARLVHDVEVVGAAEQAHEVGDGARVDDVLDGRVRLDGEDLADHHGAVQHNARIVGGEHRAELRQQLQRNRRRGRLDGVEEGIEVGAAIVVVVVVGTITITIIVVIIVIVPSSIIIIVIVSIIVVIIITITFTTMNLHLSFTKTRTN